jgi:hypothetical protein
MKRQQSHRDHHNAPERKKLCARVEGYNPTTTAHKIAASPEWGSAPPAQEFGPRGPSAGAVEGPARVCDEEGLGPDPAGRDERGATATAARDFPPERAGHARVLQRFEALRSIVRAIEATSKHLCRELALPEPPRGAAFTMSVLSEAFELGHSLPQSPADQLLYVTRQITPQLGGGATVDLQLCCDGPEPRVLSHLSLGSTGRRAQEELVDSDHVCNLIEVGWRELLPLSSAVLRTVRRRRSHRCCPLSRCRCRAGPGCGGSPTPSARRGDAENVPRAATSAHDRGQAGVPHARGSRPRP